MNEFEALQKAAEMITGSKCLLVVAYLKRVDGGYTSTRSVEVRELYSDKTIAHGTGDCVQSAWYECSKAVLRIAHERYVKADNAAQEAKNAHENALAKSAAADAFRTDVANVLNVDALACE